MKKFLDPTNLPYFGAVVQGILFSIAGDLFFASSFGWLVGLGVGMVVNFSIALASSRYADVAEKRKPLARLALIGMFLLSPTTITLSLFFSTSIWAAIAWSICVDLSIILAGAIVGKSLIPAGATAKNRSAKGSDGKKSLSGKGNRSAKESKPLVMIACRHEGAGCQMKGTQNAMNAHAKHCKFKPSIDDSLMINKSKVENK